MKKSETSKFDFSKIGIIPIDLPSFKASIYIYLISIKYLARCKFALSKVNPIPTLSISFYKIDNGF